MTPGSDIRNELAVILLAAGNSSRLGQAKQLVPYRDTFLLQHVMNQGLGLGKQRISSLDLSFYCVLGFQAKAISDKLDLSQCHLLENENWQQGLGSSIAYAINELPANTTGALLILGDQWQLTTESLASLISAWQRDCKSIVAACHHTFGPPVIFPKSLFGALQSLNNHQGAKEVIKEHINLLHAIDLPEAFADLDTPQQLKQLIESDSSKFSA